MDMKKENSMKKTICVILSAVMALALFAGCGAASAPAADTAATPAAEAPAADAALSGTVATDGSTSMEKVIGALGESFMEANKDVTFTYNPTGSGSGITAVSEGRCDIGLSSRALTTSTLTPSPRYTPARSPTGRTSAAMTRR